jgi:glycogen(starch) synthase
MTVLFEISWEVCNKVGGIYTVIRSKIPFIQQAYPDYICIGPLLDHQSDFEPQPTPPAWQDIFSSLKKRGVFCVYGRWIAPGHPTAILVGAKELVAHKDQLKFMYWDKYHIDSLKSAWEFEEPMCWATAAGMLVEEYAKRHPGDIVAQCHEWIAGFALLHLKQAGAKVGTVFTTHATMLGRSISGSGEQLYEMLDGIDARAWAYRLGVQDKHLCEVACATNADVFTTVSEITGLEAERLLGRKPDVLTYNGFFIEKFPTFEETSIRHYQARDLLREFLAYQFFPYYAFDLDKTMLFFTSGRYEFHNKGIDVLVDALGDLNRKLKAQGSDTTVAMFFWLIMGHGSVRYEVLENKNAYVELKSLVDWQGKQLLRKITLDFLSGHVPGQDDLFTSGFVHEMHEEIGHIRRKGTPPLATHDIDWDHDPLVAACRQQGLLNRQEDRVKVIIYPGYLDSADNLLNVHYYDATVGAHLGIFPSAYEPWGYTPLESAMLAVPAVTTDLAGFGRFMQNVPHEKGVFVIPRMRRSRSDVVAQLAQTLHQYTMCDKNERVQQGFAAKQLAASCDWKVFIKHYHAAYDLALKRRA